MVLARSLGPEGASPESMRRQANEWDFRENVLQRELKVKKRRAKRAGRMRSRRQPRRHRTRRFEYHHVRVSSANDPASTAQNSRAFQDAASAATAGVCRAT